MRINFNVRGVEQVQTYLKSLPRGVMRTALKAIAEYIVGDDSHGLKHNEVYKYVSRISAYGVSFFSDAQRRWYWANGGPAMIGNNRTGASSEAWTYKEVNGGYGYKLQNPTEGAYWTRSDAQAAQPAKVGWRKVMAVVEDNIKGALRHANARVGEFLRSGKKG